MKSILLVKKLLGLVEMTFGLVTARFSLPKGQAVKMIFFARCFLNSFVIANGLNKKEFRYLLLSYTGYGFGLNVLNRVSKMGILS